MELAPPAVACTSWLTTVIFDCFLHLLASVLCFLWSDFGFIGNTEPKNKVYCFLIKHFKRCRYDIPGNTLLRVTVQNPNRLPKNKGGIKCSLFMDISRFRCEVTLTQCMSSIMKRWTPAMIESEMRLLVLLVVQIVWQPCFITKWFDSLERHITDGEYPNLRREVRMCVRVCVRERVQMFASRCTHVDMSAVSVSGWTS